MSAEAATINLTAATFQESQKKRSTHTSHLNTGVQCVHSSFKEISLKNRMSIDVLTQLLCNSDALFSFSTNQTPKWSVSRQGGQFSREKG